MTRPPPAGEGANTPKVNSDERNPHEHNPEDPSVDRAERGSASDRPSHGGRLRRLGAAVSL
jgi:hypothetical protein